MRSTAIDRRSLLGAGLAGAAMLALPGATRADGGPACAACLRLPDGGFAVALLDAAGTILSTERLPGRGHGIAVSPDRRTVVAFARRPGSFALAVDASGRVRQAFAAPSGRHFYGHGVYSPDGRLLYAPENDYAAGAGVLGVYDAAAGFARVDELPGGGVGPHEAVLLADGRTLAVAVGGIATRPDSGRRKLNLPTMAPALAYLDRRTGETLERVALPRKWHQLSLRHLAVDATGAVWIGGQYEGPATDRLPLLWRHRRAGELQVAAAPDGLHASLRHYVGAVAVSGDGTRVVATSPRGGIAAVWDAADGALRATYRAADVCGAAAAPRGAVYLSDGHGAIRRNGTVLSADRTIAWDNHMAAL
jgi:hypothetical protein